MPTAHVYVVDEAILKSLRRLADELGASVAYAEDDLRPSEWVRLWPTGERSIVSLDAVETGDVASYVVVGERAYPGDRQPPRINSGARTA